MNEFQRQHVLNVATNLQRLFAEEKYLDITLSVHGTEFRSNSLLLCSSSDYFRGMFQFYDFQKRDTINTHYELPSEYLTVSGLRFLVQFLNTLGQDVHLIPKEEYEAVYSAASFLQVTSLQAMLSSFLEHNLNASSVLETIRLAALFDDRRLYNKCMVTLLEKFYSVDIFSENYRSLNQDVIQEIFSSDRVNVPRESFMVKALLSWLCGDLQSRVAYFQNNFYRLLRLSLVGTDEMNIILNDVRFVKAATGLNLLRSAHISSIPAEIPGTCGVFDHMLNKPRSGTSFRIYSIGGVQSSDPEHVDSIPLTPEFFSYDSEIAYIDHHQPPDEASRVYHAVACSLGWLYIMGGESEEGQLMSHCCRFNLLDQTWLPMARLDSPRSHHSAICIETFVYVFGGYRLNWISSYSPATDSILLYDTTSDAWRPCSHRLPFAAIDMGSVLLHNRRLVMLAGGLHECGTEMIPSDQVVLYDPAEESASCFVVLPRLPLPLTGLSLAYDEPSDRVLVCGGKTDQAHAIQSNALACSLSGHVFAFDMGTHSWSSITVLDYPRYHCCCFVSRSTLYVLGGITVDEVVESMILLNEDNWGDGLQPDHSPSLDHLYHSSSFERSMLLQTPYRTCHFVEAWRIDRKTDETTVVDHGENQFRLRRLNFRPARHKDNRLVLTRCLASYCLAPYFPSCTDI